MKKLTKKILQKILDKCSTVWYNEYNKERKRDTTMKKTICIILATAILCSVCSFRLGHNHARKTAQLVNVNDYSYTIQYGEGAHAFFDRYEFAN